MQCWCLTCHNVGLVRSLFGDQLMPKKDCIQVPKLRHRGFHNALLVDAVNARDETTLSKILAFVSSDPNFDGFEAVGPAIEHCAHFLARNIKTANDESMNMFKRLCISFPDSDKIATSIICIGPQRYFDMDSNPYFYMLTFAVIGGHEKLVKILMMHEVDFDDLHINMWLNKMIERVFHNLEDHKAPRNYARTVVKCIKAMIDAGFYPEKLEAIMTTNFDLLVLYAEMEHKTSYKYNTLVEAHRAKVARALRVAGPLCRDVAGMIAEYA